MMKCQTCEAEATTYVQWTIGHVGDDDSNTLIEGWYCSHGTPSAASILGKYDQTVSFLGAINQCEGGDSAALDALEALPKDTMVILDGPVSLDARFHTEEERACP